MRLFSRLLLPLCVVAMTLPALADDAGVPQPPAPTQTSPSFTFPAPMNSSTGQGGIIDGDAAPTPIIHGDSAPMMGSTPLGSGPLGSQRTRRSNRETIEQFQSSSYWTAPQPFHPGGAPSYSHRLAGAGGMHTRYPYFKYRAPWTYQGPAAISHTIEW